ncbi:hypothetical protein BU25DRAFT_200820 [Macroventuria anomochaeta]|uniref:Uncharacterized protein n=1 Tax=Macroventuria anomochaeta TaxID=301207 RepID=A0ACB6RP33_9PLEO|nr:uncharacterized protein BU25DRAFT_200820 [Macroventuria anomochaeta]KAF2623052.1 hypothetical protein BU25DRAFT_200820 [Macroventuria anomochaeta]
MIICADRPDQLCQGSKIVVTTQVQAQGEASPIVPAHGRLLMQRLRQESYSQMICTLSKSFYAWSEAQHFAHCCGFGRLVRRPVALFVGLRWRETLPYSRKPGSIHKRLGGFKAAHLTYMKEESWAGRVRQHAGVFLFTGWCCSARGYQDGRVCASIICWSEKVDKA